MDFTFIKISRAENRAIILTLFCYSLVSVRLRTDSIRFPQYSTVLLRRLTMSIGTIILIVVVLMLIGVLPTWPHSAHWGYAPSGLLGTVLIVLLILLLLGKL